MNYKGDTILIDQVLTGNTDAFSLIVDHYKDRVFNLAIKICGNREDAEEIAQDSFLKAYSGLSSFMMKSSFSTWLYRIVYNTGVSYLRTRRKGILSIEDFPADANEFVTSSSDEDAEQDYRNSLLAFGFQKLTEEERAIVSLYYYDELETDEIASITGISRSNVKVKLFRARQKMLEIIKKAETKKIYNSEQRRRF